MKTLVFDTETTGFPISSIELSAPAQPHMIQIAALLVEGHSILQNYSTIIKCPIDVPDGAFKVHGISKEKSQEVGIPLTLALSRFNDLLVQADRLVAHNTQFDMKIITIAYLRSGLDREVLIKIPKACTMKTATPIMRNLGKRWTLDSCYRHFCDPEGFSNAHDASADTLACFEVLHAMESKDIAVVSVV